MSNVYVVPPVFPRLDCVLLNVGVDGVETLVLSFRSAGLAQARKTASRIEGVNRDSVRWESVKAPSRSRFFCENSEGISDPPSRDKDDISLASRTFPLASTASCGGLANGSTGISSSSFFSDLAACAASWSSLALYSGHHNRKDNL